MPLIAYKDLNLKEKFINW